MELQATSPHGESVAAPAAGFPAEGRHVSAVEPQFGSSTRQLPTWNHRTPYTLPELINIPRPTIWTTRNT